MLNKLYRSQKGTAQVDSSSLEFPQDASKRSLFGINDITFIIYATLMAMLTLLSGCSTMRPSSPANLRHLTWQERQQQLRTFTGWDIRGALSITYNNRTDMTSFEWQNNQNNYLINIHSPMNLASVKIIGYSNKVILQQSSGKQAEAPTAEKLMQQQLGWVLPINNLNYWIRGLPAPKIKTTAQYDSYSRIQSMTQQNWQITYDTYGSFYGIDLPTKIYLTAPQLRAKIVIKQWLDIRS